MLEGNNLSISFGDQKILNNISIQIADGERVALLGPSGAGKTTLLRILSGILPSSQGDVFFEGVPPVFTYKSNVVSNRKWVWPKVTLVFQDLQLFPNLTGFDNCFLGFEAGHQLAFREIMELAKELKVNHCLNKIPRKMSQGEQQRIAVIRALVKKPQFLLMDEPTSAIDPITKKELSRVLIEWSETKSIGILIATHDWEFAKEIAHKFLIIRDGSVKSFNSIIDATSSLSGLIQ